LAKKGPGNKPKQICRTYIAWIFSKLADGQKVNMPGLGTIHATYRKERFGVGQFRCHQPATFVLKFSPSEPLKKHMKRLAKEKPNSFK
jgi:nucleoid DNA-binding protein